MSRVSLRVWCEIVCNECSETTCGQFVSAGRVPIRAMRKEAEMAGWVFEGRNSFCSQKCRDALMSPTKTE